MKSPRIPLSLAGGALQRRGSSVFTALFLLCCLMPPACPGLPASEPLRHLPGELADPTARYLGGLPVDPGSPIGGIAREPSALAHAEMIGQAFQRFDAERASRMRQWAPAALGGIHTSSAPLFYMFSGPDFLYATQLFPAASTMVLCGLEPVGALPDLRAMDAASRHNGLAQIRNSLQAILSFSFFKTKDMKTDLRGHSFEGTVPLLLCFLARTGKTVTDARLALLDGEGNLFEFVPEHAADARRFVRGVRIMYRDSAAPRGDQALFYFSADISDSGLARHGGLLKLCERLGRGSAFVKSASYLMHESYFSKVRSFLLENTDNLLQDDSGIPLRFFNDGKWAMRIFGAYPGPIELFKEKYQPDLAALYKKTTPAPLDFGIGYRHRPGSSTLMLATRGAAAVPAAPPAGPAPEPPALPDLPPAAGAFPPPGALSGPAIRQEP